MHRLFHHIVLGLLLFGMTGPMTARAWRVAVQTGMLEEEHGSHKALAISRHSPRLMGRGTVPFRGPRRVHAWHARPRVADLAAPAQTQGPRAFPVWCPLRLAPDGDDPEHA